MIPTYSKKFRAELLRKIRKGGIIIAPRRAGKTVAILTLMDQDSSYVVSCPNYQIAKEYKSKAESMGLSLGCLKRIVGPLTGKDLAAYAGRGSKIIIDEFFWWPGLTSLMGHRDIHAYVSSPFEAMHATDGKKWVSVPGA